MTLTLDQARAMHWPFRSPRQPMGALLDRGALSIPELQSALRKAYSPRFKAACQIILQELLPAIESRRFNRQRDRVVVVRSASHVTAAAVCPIWVNAVQADGSGWTCVG